MRLNPWMAGWDSEVPDHHYALDRRAVDRVATRCPYDGHGVERVSQACELARA